MPQLHHEPRKLTAVPAGCRVVAHLAPGDCVGEAALLAEGGTRSASIQAEKLVQVCNSQSLSRLLCCMPWACPSAPPARAGTAVLLPLLQNAVADAHTAAPLLPSITGSCSRQGAAVAAQQSSRVVAMQIPHKGMQPCTPITLLALQTVVMHRATFAAMVRSMGGNLLYHADYLVRWDSSTCLLLCAPCSHCSLV